jgi:hypothetical protein
MRRRWRTWSPWVAFHNRGGTPSPWRFPAVGPLELSAPEQADLVAFLHALDGEVAAEVRTPPVLPQ